MIDARAYLRERSQFTDDKMKEIRADLLERYSDSNFCIVADGSYARKEASEESDIDFYVIYKGDKPKKKLLEDVSSAIGNYVPNMPSDGGPFATLSCAEEMMENIGGEEDSNSKLTKRVLLLLEGDWLFNKELFDEVRFNLINKYVNDRTSEPQIALFLLNDFIRYYRTVCVDFNYKTVEDSKPWGIRNIKLVFSRKLLYFGGIIAIAETAHMTANKKREKLLELFDRSPLERIEKICGQSFDEALVKYAYFLEQISDPKVREILKGIKNRDEADHEKFRELKNEGHQFTACLFRLLKNRYDSSHSIHRMLVL